MKATFRKAPAPYNYTEMIFVEGEGPRAQFTSFTLEEGHNTATLEYIEQGTTPATIEDAPQIKKLIDYYEEGPAPVNIEPVNLAQVLNPPHNLGALLCYEKARQIYEGGTEPVFLTFRDGTEAEAETPQDMKNHARHGGIFSIERS